MKDELKMAYMVTPSAMTQSMSTAWYRFTGTPMACSVTPEEYMSRLLMAKSCTMAKSEEDDDEPGRDGALVGEGQEAPRPRPDVERRTSPPRRPGS